MRDEKYENFCKRIKENKKIKEKLHSECKSKEAKPLQLEEGFFHMFTY